MRYFKVIKENFLWDIGCVLRPCTNGYSPIDDLYKKHDCDEYISTKIVENSPDYFERVYKVDLLTKTVYVLKDKAKELLSKDYQN